MGWDVTLCEPGTKEAILFDHPHEMRGSTYAVGGTREAWLAITYNYSQWYRKKGVFPDTDDEDRAGLNFIGGMSGSEAIPVLENAIRALESMDEDLTDKEIEEIKSRGCTGYWMPSRKNAIKPLYQLLAMARMRPDGVFDVA